MKIQFLVRLLSMTVCLACLSVTSTSAQQCGEVLEKPVTLDESGIQSFPQKKFGRKLARAKKGLKEWLDNADKLVDANIKEELQAERNAGYPLCLSTATCPSTVRKVYKWQIAGQKCWLVEPIIWVTCSTDVPDEVCQPKVDDSRAVGYSCRERYTTTQVWAFCTRGGFKLYTIGVPTACMPMYNPC